MRNKSVIVTRIFLTTLTAFVVGFIFYNSALDADESTVYSSGVLSMIEDFFYSLHIDITISENFVRKCAHFAEFFTLGVLMSLTVQSYINKLKYKLLLAPLLGLAVACIDETIHLHSAGRSGQLSDVILDFFGVCTAVIMFYIISKCVKKKDKEVLN